MENLRVETEALKKHYEEKVKKMTEELKKRHEQKVQQLTREFAMVSGERKRSRSPLSFEGGSSSPKSRRVGVVNPLPTHGSERSNSISHILGGDSIPSTYRRRSAGQPGPRGFVFDEETAAATRQSEANRAMSRDMPSTSSFFGQSTSQGPTFGNENRSGSRFLELCGAEPSVPSTSPSQGYNSTTNSRRLELYRAGLCTYGYEISTSSGEPTRTFDNEATSTSRRWVASWDEVEESTPRAYNLNIRSESIEFYLDLYRARLMAESAARSVEDATPWIYNTNIESSSTSHNGEDDEESLEDDRYSLEDATPWIYNTNPQPPTTSCRVEAYLVEDGMCTCSMSASSIEDATPWIYHTYTESPSASPRLEEINALFDDETLSSGEPTSDNVLMPSKYLSDYKNDLTDLFIYNQAPNEEEDQSGYEEEQDDDDSSA